MKVTIHGSLLQDNQLVLGGPWVAESTNMGWSASTELERQTLVQNAPGAGRYEFRIAGDPTPYMVDLKISEAAGRIELRIEGRGLPSVLDESASPDG